MIATLRHTPTKVKSNNIRSSEASQIKIQQVDHIVEDETTQNHTEKYTERKEIKWINLEETCKDAGLDI